MLRSLALVASLSVVAISHAKPFTLDGCTDPPFKPIATSPAIDGTCPAEGTPTSPALALEYRGKNNLCATGTSTRLTMHDFVALQTIANGLPIVFGDRNQPVADRSILKNILTHSSGSKIGEGDLVRMVAYIVDATDTGTTPHSDGTCGEGVNCRLCGKENNDIHIDVASAPNKKSCQGIVAEMIPHMRPVSWTPTNLLKTKGLPIRISGHLFLDSRHHTRLCNDTKNKQDPPRVSLWEIHPVYGIEVCTAKKKSKCTDSNAGVWKPLDQWITSHP